MKVVVTGASGQLGQHVVQYIAEAGHILLALDRRPHPTGHKPAWTVDLLDSGSLFEAFCGADAIVHLAAHIAPNLASDCRTFNENVAMTYNALKAASAMGVSKVVVASSLAAYGFLYGDKGRSPQYLPIDENHPCSPTDPYGLSKVVGETLADSFARAGMTITSLRFPGINYDPTFKRIESIMLDPGYRQTGFWSYIDVRDAALACRLALESKHSGHRIFNVAAPNSNMREPTAMLARRFFPSLGDVRGDDRTNWSGVNSTRAEQELGFRCNYLWETALPSIG